MKRGEIPQFEADGLRMKDGSFVPADIIVLATGKPPNSQAVRDPIVQITSRAERFSGMRLSAERDLFGASMNNMSPRVFGGIQDIQGK